MELEILNDLQKIGSLKDEWNTLAQASTNPSVFSTYEFVLTSWQWFDATNSQLHVLTMRANGHLVGLLPLQTRRQRVGATAETIIEYAGTTGGDRPYILTRPQHEGSAWQTALKAIDLMRWDRLHFPNLPEISPGRLALEHHFRHTDRYDVTHENSGSAAIIDPELACGRPSNLGLDPSVEACNQACKRFLRHFTHASFTSYSSGSNIDEGIDRYITFSTSGNAVQPSFFTTSDRHIGFFRSLMRRLVGSGWSELHFVSQGDETLAAGVTHLFGGNALFHETIWSSAHQPLQPGAFLIARAIRRLSERSFERAEGIVGHSSHMWPWARGQVSTINLSVGNRSWKSALRRSPLSAISPTPKRVAGSAR